MDPLVEKLIESLFSEFEDFGEECLKNAVRDAKEYCREMMRNTGRWITFMGTNGGGKTFLAERIWDFFRQEAKYLPIPNHPLRARCSRRLYWPSFAQGMASGAFNSKDIVMVMHDYDFLFIDEFTTKTEKPWQSLGLMEQILNGRLGKPTVITSNLFLDQISEANSTIASRIIRNDSFVVQILTVDYFSRKNRRNEEEN